MLETNSKLNKGNLALIHSLFMWINAEMHSINLLIQKNLLRWVWLAFTEKDFAHLETHLRYSKSKNYYFLAPYFQELSCLRPVGDTSSSEKIPFKILKLQSFWRNFVNKRSKMKHWFEVRNFFRWLIHSFANFIRGEPINTYKNS